LQGTMPSASILSGYVPISFTSEQLAELKSEVTHRASYASRISLAFAIRLAAHPLDRLAVLREVDVLEGYRRPGTPEDRKLETTVDPEEKPFKYPPLAPLWHKHFFMPRNAMRNSGDRWNIARGNGNRDLHTLLSDVAANSGHDPARWPGELMHRIVVGGLQERADAQRLTGDWIIFGKHEGQNYYLDLATHEEGNGPIKSAALMQKLRTGNAWEFSFLFPD